MDTRRNSSLAALLCASILLAFIAQYYFRYRSDYMWDGVLIYGVAMVLFAVVVVRVEGRPFGSLRRGLSLWQPLWEALRRSMWRAAALAGGLVLSFYVTLAAGARPSGRAYWDLLIFWWLAVMLAAGTFVDWAGLGQRWRARMSALQHVRPEGALLAGLVALTVLLRASNLNGIPYVLTGDEAAMGLEALDVLQGGYRNPFATGWLSHPVLYFYIQAAFLWLLGPSTAALRLSSVLASGGIAVLLYLLARRFYGRWVAILATFFYATYHFAIHYGRMGLNNIWDPFFALGAVYGLTVGLEERRPAYLALGGALTGLAVYFYMGARLIPIILGVYVLHWSLRERDFWRKHLAHLLIFGAVALVVSLPLLAYFRARPMDLSARWAMLGIFPSGWVDAQVESTGRSVLSVLADQFLKAALGFNYTTDPSFHYRPGIPLLDFVTSVFFVFGLTYAIIRWRRREYFVLVAWLLLNVILGGMLLKDPPWSPRFVISIPPVVLCMTLGMVKVAEFVRGALREQRSVALALSAALVLIGSWQSIWFYFGDYTPNRLLGERNTEVANDLGHYLVALGPDYHCYLFGAPRLYYGHPPIAFLARGIQGTDVVDRLEGAVDFVNAERNAVFVFLPERIGELDMIQRYYPAGRQREFRDDRGRLRFISYEVDLLRGA
jgi:4-amino-4-deoxy-L-arabinose transferase-like glycosyltransferase